MQDQAGGRNGFLVHTAMPHPTPHLRTHRGPEPGKRHQRLEWEEDRMAEPAPEAALMGATPGHMSQLSLHTEHMKNGHRKARLSKCIPPGKKTEDVKIRPKSLGTNQGEGRQGDREPTQSWIPLSHCVTAVI